MEPIIVNIFFSANIISGYHALVYVWYGMELKVSLSKQTVSNRLSVLSL